MRRSAFLAICLSGLLAACATSGATGETTASSAASRADASRITSEQIVAADLPTAYDLVEKLRRPWLRRSGAGGEVAVYQDERPLGGADELRKIPSTMVAELQYVDNADAVRRWGGGEGGVRGAVIVVVPRR